MLTTCAFCGKEELLPFICRYCNEPFCAEHRLPESHNCLAISTKVISMRKMRNGSYETSIPQKLSFRISRTEILHLAAAVFIFFIVHITQLIQFRVTTLLSIVGIIALAFTFHELAHKFTAQHYGLWSEFRLDPLGMVISILTAFMPFKIIAPGAVVIFGTGVTKESIGKIALVGPLTNIIQAFFFIFLIQFFPLFWFAAVLNVELAMFNLLPISILDGRKVFQWSKKSWIVAFMLALILWIILS